MKKILSAALCLLLVFTLTVSVFAAPSKENHTGEAEAYEKEEDTEPVDCKMIITGYDNRATLPTAVKNGEKAKADIEAAYAAIDAGLAVAASSTGIAQSDLAVAYLFDISPIITCPHGDDEHSYVSCSIGGINGAVAVLHWSGSWSFIKPTIDGSTVSFSSPNASPFAIIVKKGSSSGENTSPKTGLAPVALALVPMVGAYAWLKKKEQ